MDTIAQLIAITQSKQTPAEKRIKLAAMFESVWLKEETDPAKQFSDSERSNLVAQSDSEAIFGNEVPAESADILALFCRGNRDFWNALEDAAESAELVNVNNTYTDGTVFRF